MWRMERMHLVSRHRYIRITRFSGGAYTEKVWGYFLLCCPWSMCSSATSHHASLNSHDASGRIRQSTVWRHFFTYNTWFYNWNNHFFFLKIKCVLGWMRLLAAVPAVATVKDMLSCHIGSLPVIIIHPWFWVTRFHRVWKSKVSLSRARSYF